MSRILVLKIYVVLISLVTFTCKESKIEEPPISEVIGEKFTSKTTNNVFNYTIYKPFELDEKTVPILYLLHGHGGNHLDWFDIEEGNIQHILDSLIKSKKIPPVIAVSLEAKNSWYVDHNIPMEQIYLKEFMPLIESQFASKIDTNNRIIVGNSMGGYGALNYGLKYPELFEEVILLAPAAYNPVPPQMSSSRKIDVYKIDGVFNDSIWQDHLYTTIALSENKNNYPKFFTSTGDDDPYEIFDVVVQLKNYYDINNLKYEISVVNGKHSWDVWRYCFTQDIIRALND